MATTLERPNTSIKHLCATYFAMLHATVTHYLHSVWQRLPSLCCIPLPLTPCSLPDRDYPVCVACQCQSLLTLCLTEIKRSMSHNTATHFLISVWQRLSNLCLTPLPLTPCSVWQRLHSLCCMPLPLTSCSLSDRDYAVCVHTHCHLLLALCLIEIMHSVCTQLPLTTCSLSDRD